MSANGDDGHKSVEAAVANFLDETELTKKPKTLAAYTTALAYFRESCPRLFLEDIERKDLLKFCAFLRDEKKQAPRSVYNKFEIVMTFLKAQGIRGLIGKNDWPRATFATRCLWAGVDLRTVQQWLAHSDMESTMRKPSRSQQVREKVNEIFA